MTGPWTAAGGPSTQQGTDQYVREALPSVVGETHQTELDSTWDREQYLTSQARLGDLLIHRALGRGLRK